MSYNGYKNYQTWAVCLWIWNTEIQGYWQERAAYGALDCELKEWFTNDLPDNPGLFTDLLMHSLDCVDWQEVAATFTD